MRAKGTLREEANAVLHVAHVVEIEKNVLRDSNANINPISDRFKHPAITQEILYPTHPSARMDHEKFRRVLRNKNASPVYRASSKPLSRWLFHTEILQETAAAAVYDRNNR